MPHLLELRNANKHYGALKVTDNLSFHLNQGEALGILGPNGAGKSTLFNLISGDVYPDSGQVLYCGQEITRLPAARRSVRGIARSYQVPHPFSGMTVFENLMVGASFSAGLGRDEAAAHCVAVLKRTGLAHRANQLSGSLGLLDRKRLELARALSTRPRLLLLDEIAGGLTDSEARALVSTIHDIRAGGISIIWIEHVVRALLAVADRLLVINFGALLTEGAPQAVMGDPKVQAVYMGTPA